MSRDNMNVLGEGGRSRDPRAPSPGMRQVRIFKGPRDNYEETVQEYIDEAGPIRGKIAGKTANTVTVEYPEERFLANQREAEERALFRVRLPAPVGSASVHQNTVGRGAEDTLEAHLEAAKGDSESKFDG